MKFLGMFTGVIAFLLTTAATAGHFDTKSNSWVRKHVMGMMDEQARILEAMASGAAQFDLRAARTAAGEISEYARQVPPLYASGGPHGVTEARPEIWQDFESFRNASLSLAEIAEVACAEIDSPDSVAKAYRSIEAACQSCHAAFRK